MNPIVLVTAHSGGFVRKPNSMEYVASMLALHPDIMEVDVRTTLDKIVVLWHDPSIPGESKTIAESTFSELKQQFPQLLTLDQVVPILKERDIMLNLDIKDIKAVEPVCLLIAQHHWQRQVLFSGCQEEELELLYRLEPEAKALFNADRYPGKTDYRRFAMAMVERTRKSKAFALNINHEDVFPPLLHACRKALVPLFVWTVDDRARMEELVKLGVYGITTHEVALLTQVLGSRDGMCAPSVLP